MTKRIPKSNRKGKRELRKIYNNQILNIRSLKF